MPIHIYKKDQSILYRLMFPCLCPPRKPPRRKMSLNLRIDETDPTLKEVQGRYSDWKAFCVLRRFLEPVGDLSIEQATALLHDMLPTRKEEHLGGQPSMFACVLLDVARQIPYAHPAQIQLVQLVRKLGKSDRLTFLVHDYDQVWKKSSA
jgi:hypothetical protein